MLAAVPLPPRVTLYGCVVVAFYVAVLLFSVGCGGDSFTGQAVSSDAGAGVDAGPTTPDSAPAADTGQDAVDGGIDVSPPGADAAIGVDAGQDAVGHVDAGPGGGDGATCTPITYTAPTTCACFFAGSCAVDGGPATGCIWAETPLTITGQPTCRGCGQIAWKPNTCGKCKETFTCACLAAYLDPGQKCCDGPGGPYLSDYACP